MLWFFLFFIWIWILISIIMDIFRSHDLGGFAKALWLIFIIFLPFLGVLVYLIARGHKMQEHSMKDAANAQAALDQHVRQVAGTNTASELADLASLRDSGAISDAEFEQAKAKILG
jgi:hypothetical protein